MEEVGVGILSLRMEYETLPVIKDSGSGKEFPVVTVSFATAGRVFNVGGGGRGGPASWVGFGSEGTENPGYA